MKPTQNSVSLSHVRKSFDAVVAVDDFNLDIEKGELITLLGPSGCGKTTVLRMLAGFETPTSGKIAINGEDMTHRPANQRNCTMVFQSYALFPHMTVEQNIRYGLKLRKVSGEVADTKFERIVSVVGLKGYEKRKPAALSGGQQQRVALARALIVEPELLLFDEPLSNLDAKLRESMRNEIRRIQKELSITSVYVTHDQSEAMAISDRVVVMSRSKVVQIGSPQEVYRRPATSFVADFMGASNILDVEPVTGSVQSGATVRMRLGAYEFDALPSRAGGMPSKVVVRPEALEIFPESDAGGIIASVVSERYLGSHFEYDVKLHTGAGLIARLELDAGFKPIAGQAVKLKFRSSSAQALGE